MVESEKLRLLRPHEAANRLGVTVLTLRHWADAGLIPHVTLPSGQRRFPRAEVERLAQPVVARTRADATREGQ